MGLWSTTVLPHACESTLNVFFFRFLFLISQVSIKKRMWEVKGMEIEYFL